MQGMKELIDALTSDHSHYPSDWLRAMLSAFKQLTGIEPMAGEGDISRHPTTAACLEAYAQALAKNEPFTDILGPTYMELGSKWKQSSLGQFFTPQNIAVMMASMCGTATASSGGLTRVIDPACGSGCQLLSYMKVINQMGRPGELSEFLFVGVDLDPVCTDMTAVQVMANCNLHRLEVGELIVVRGNSLKPWETWQKVVHATAIGKSVTVDPNAQAFREAVNQSAAAQDQLSLFMHAA